MSKTVKWFLAIYCAVMLGALIFYKALQKHGSSSREPSSINLGFIPYEISDEDPETTIRMIKMRVLQQLTVRATEEGHKIGLGAISVNTSEGHRHLCQLFPMIEIQLRAHGIMVSGESPRITVKSHCRPHESKEVLEYIALPWHSLSMDEPQNVSFDLENGSSLTTRFIDDFWPEAWYLAEINLISPREGESIRINSYEIEFVNSETVVMK